ncbi:MAG: transporter substrate-binding domain-containing protein [Hahellaceae bacterium]|nr:transporter substrate-binding domain-containing protein [Hahellaceae bacterium]
MKLIFILLLGVGVLSANPALSQSIDDIEWITEDYQPFSYIGKMNMPAGLSIEIVQALWKEVGLKKSASDIKFHPWARGYQMVQQQKRICLFAMSVTEQRMARFQFVGFWKGSNIAIIAKRSRGLKIDSIADLDNLNIGVVREDIGEKLLTETGTKPFLYPVTTGDQLIRMLALDRLDAIAFGDIPAAWTMKVIGIDPSQFELVFVLKQGSSGLAFNKEADAAVVRKFQDAFDTLNKEGVIDTIRNKYLILDTASWH